jgi:hypothetical protein
MEKMHSLWDAGKNGPSFHGHRRDSGERSFSTPVHPGRDEKTVVSDSQEKIAGESSLG